MVKGELATGRFLIPYRVIGHGGEPLLCINGAQQSMAVWRSFASRFCQEFRVVLWDSPGQGRARILSGPCSITLDEQIGIVVDLTAHLGFGEVSIFAASWGAIVAAGFASAFPDRVGKLVLASLGIQPNLAILEMIRAGLSMADRGAKERIGPLMVEGFGKQIPEAYERRIVEQFQTISEEHLRVFYEHCDFVAGIRHISDLIDLRRIRAETLLLIRGSDGTINQQHVHQACADIPHARTMIVEDGGHFLHFETGREDILELYHDLLVAREADPPTDRPRVPLSALVSLELQP